MVRLLHVTIIEGTDLVRHKEPYVCIELLDITGRPIKNERAKTPTAPYGPTISWITEKRPSLPSGSSVTGGVEETKEDDDVEGVTMTLGRKHDLRNVGSLPVLRLSVWGREVISKDEPLGMVLVDLAELPTDGTTVPKLLQLEPAMGMDRSILCGSLKVSFRLDAAESNRIFSATAAAAAAGGSENRAEGFLVDAEDGPGYEDEKHKAREPNLLVVRVRRARGLPGMDISLVGESLSDPFVRMICDGVEQKTKVVEKSLSPTWEETFEFPVKDFSRRLDVMVLDWDVVAAERIGGFGIRLEDLVHKKRVTRWFQLLDAVELHDPENPLGELELSVQWIHDPRAKDLSSKRLTILEIVQRTLGLYEFSSDTNDDEDEGPKAKKRGGKNRPKKSVNKKLEQKKREDQEAEKKAMRKELMDIEVKSGDYTIYVHVIEARDLKAEDLQGTSDPVVYVEAFGQRFATDVKQACLSCVFDETFVISLRNLDKDLFEEGVIRVSVMDADGPVAIKNDLIGAYSFDAANVYFHKDHEIHRQWVALVDDENPRDTGTQGYLQLSIAIVGPGDKLKVHDEAEDRRKEREAEAKSGGIDGLVMVPPSVTTKLKWLVTTVWRADYLPVMDTGPIGYHGGDFYTTVSVSGGAPGRTKSKTMFGSRSAMCPVWRTQLWVPVSIPSMSGTVKTTIKDWDSFGNDEIVACVNMKLKDLEKLEDRKHKARWFPLYGAPLYVPGSTEIAELGKRMTSSEPHQTNSRVMYENLPQKASTYRGRILMSREIRDELPAGREESTPWRRKVGRLGRKKEPPTSSFAMRCYVCCGADIPQAASVIRMGLNFKNSVKISIGSHVLETRAVENEHGTCEWAELLESKEPIMLPSDSSQMPDVVIHLQRGDDKIPICFHRFPAADLLEKGMQNVSPGWMLLQEDKVLNWLPPGQFPGSVLVKLALGSLQEFSDTEAHWKAEALKLRERTSYLLRVHVYQGRDLPAADANGLMDPYLKLQCQGETLNTETFMYLGKPVHRKRATVDPMWYFTWEADLSMPRRELQKYFPQVLIQLMDYDNMDSDDYTGCMFLNLGSCPIVMDQNNIPPPPTPTWMPFFLEKPGDSSGELLVSYQLINTTRAGLALKPPPDLNPELRPAYLEVLALGIRGMQPFQMLPMQMPYMQIEMDLPHNHRVSLTTKASKKPSGADANFLERMTQEVELPVHEIYAPRLKLRVRDVRLGGFLTPVVAVSAVDLAPKLPWSSTFEGRRTQHGNAKAIMELTGAPVFDDMFRQGQGVEEDARSYVRSLAELGTAPQAAMDEGDDDESSGAEIAGLEPWDHINADADGEVESKIRAEAGAAGAAAGADPATVGANCNGGVQSNDMLVLEDAPEKDIVQVMGQEDEGAGVFGAILHEPVVREKVWAKARAAWARQGDTDAADDEEGPPKYMINRPRCDAEFERDVEISPFETYELFRGQKFGGQDGQGDYRLVGKFKCIIRVTLGHPDDEPMFAPLDKKRNEEILNQLLIPKGYKMRLYVLQAINLTPMDMGIGGRPGKSDPYLKVKLGKELFDDKKNYIDDVTDADIYKCVELNCELPGAGQLQIEIMDHDDIGSDELIGRTVIDLEDRWFSQQWQAVGGENRVEDLANPEKMRWQTKPIENRSLYVATSNAPQGLIQTWVDIMPPGDAKAFPADDVALPPALKFEVRLVIWKCKDVVSMDWASGLNDLFVKAWMEGTDPQVTDTHWRAKGGKGSFNWRMKFEVELGPRTRSSKFPYLTLQMWDKDIIKWNDCIAETILDLGKYFRRAYKKKTEVVKLFESVQTQRAKEALIKTQQALAKSQVKALEEELETGIVNPLLGEPPEGDPNAPGSPTSSQSPEAEVWQRPGDMIPDDSEDEDGGNCCASCCCSCFGGKKPMTPLELREENDRRRALGMPLISEEEGLTVKEARKRRKEEGDEEARELIQKVKVLVGLSSDDPPDSKWINMEKIDRKTGRKKPMGQCCIGIQIFPVDKAAAQPAGMGRAEPNDSPFLPPPTGRLQFGWNPISIIAQLLGPRLCCILCCCLCCVLFMLSVMFLQPMWTFLINLAFSL